MNNVPVINLKAIARSLNRSSLIVYNRELKTIERHQLHTGNVPSFVCLAFFARHSRNARKKLDMIYRESVKFVIYRQSLLEVVHDRSGSDCSCDFVVFSAKCNAFKAKIRCLMDAFVKVIGRLRLKLFMGTSPALLAFKIVLTRDQAFA